MVGSLKVGIDWGVEGPKSGFFPFYVGAIIVISSAVNLAQALRADADKIVRRLEPAPPGPGGRDPDHDLCRC